MQASEKQFGPIDVVIIGAPGELLANGFLTEEEFATEKARVLGG